MFIVSLVFITLFIPLWRFAPYVTKLTSDKVQVSITVFLKYELLEKSLLTLSEMNSFSDTKIWDWFLRITLLKCGVRKPRFIFRIQSKI